MTVSPHKERLPALWGILVLISLSAPLQVSGALDFIQTSTPSGSWALGVVVPQGAALSGPAVVSWPDTTNLTALIKVPSLNATDATVLLVLSVMIDSDSVLQVAVGLFPHTNTWRAVGWFIEDASALPQQYDWVLNSSTPILPPLSSVTLSIFQSGDSWHYQVTDLHSKSTVVGEFASAASVPFRAGDQEAFALESYTYNTTVLSRMGNVTLTSLLLDGREVTGGFYYLSDWAPSRSPLFIVGGLSAPSSISVQDLHNGTFIWSSTTVWAVVGLPSLALVYYAALATLFVVPAVLLARWAVNKRSGANGSLG
jgi:hypothetical protein